MTEALSVVQPQRQSLAGFTPRDAKGLAWLANEVVKSGMFMVGRRTMTGSEAFVVMMKGAELGLTPMQSLAEISIIKGRPFVSKDVLTARITRSPRCAAWDPSDCDAKHCTIAFQVVGGDPTSLTTVIDDIPERYFKPSAQGEPSNWTLVPEDMLFAWTVRRIARRFFPEALLDIGDAQPDYDETKVINVGRVEREVGTSDFGTHAGCGGTWFLQSNSRTGGAYLRCERCQATTAPPDEVRDLVRGTPEALTLAGPALEAGEREPEPGELDAIEGGEATDGGSPEPPVETTAPPVESGAGPSLPQSYDDAIDEAFNRRADALIAGAALPPGEAHDAGFAEAAGISPEAAQHAPQVMSRTEADEAMQAVIAHLSAVKVDKERLALAHAIIRAHGYTDDGLTSWMMKHAEELPGILSDLAATDAQQELSV